MKETRSIFLFIGKEPGDVKAVLDEVKDFKAVTLIESNATAEKVLEIFSNNKSIVTADKNVKTYAKHVFEICVNDSTQLLHVSTKYDIREQFKEIAETCNIDIGDHKANATKNGATQANCVFCEYVDGKLPNFHKILYASPNFIVFPTIGQFLPGYLLIVPNKHVMSSAELNDVERVEMLEVIDDISYILKTFYKKDIIIFENGSGKGGHGKDKSSIVHAHVHILPFETELLKTSTEKGIPLSEVAYDDLSDYADYSYLLVRNYDQKWYINNNQNLYIPRQYIRQLLAEAAHIPGDLWNWRTRPFKKATLKTYLDIKKYMCEHPDLWSERIKKRAFL